MDYVKEEVEVTGEGSAFDEAGRPFSELRDSGLLWLINRVVFHPRGYALAIHFEDGERKNATGWSLLGDGEEIWEMGVSEDELFDRVAHTLRDQTEREKAKTV